MSTFSPGDVVKVLAPFNADFPDTYTVEVSYQAEGDGTLIEQCKLVELESHFAAHYLEHV